MGTSSIPEQTQVFEIGKGLQGEAISTGRHYDGVESKLYQEISQIQFCPEKNAPIILEYSNAILTEGFHHRSTNVNSAFPEQDSAHSAAAEPLCSACQ